mmetsp:Transcript_13273/g.2078  ORF Transcript_13273/g.2078 Transcript_13273/m.2078 type:complete len:84 (+) Transcript_13273:672-923(+)
MECIKTYTGILKRGIKYVSFSPDGTKIAALGADEEQCVVIYDITNQDRRGAMQGLVASGKAGRNVLLCIKFDPNSNDKIYACG